MRSISRIAHRPLPHFFPPQNVPIGAVCSALIYIYVPKTIGRAHMIVVKSPVVAAAPAAAEIKDTEASLDKDAVSIANPASAAVAAGGASATSSPAAPASDDHHELDVGTVDTAGIVLVLASVTCLCLAVTWGGDAYPWDSWRIILLLVVAALSGGGLVYVESYVAADPVVPMRLFKSWNFSICIALGFLSGWAMFGSYVYLPVFFQVR